jgi:hypothetical protein
MGDRVEILLLTDAKTALLEMGKFSAKSNAWEDNKVILEGEEPVIRVDRGWFITRHPPTFRFSQGVLDQQDIEQAMAGAARGCCCNRCDATLCYGVTVTPQRSVGVARSTGR